jgi:hypothetical protein
MALDREMEFYTTNLESWRAEHAGEFVVIKDDNCLGFYSTENDALAAGASEYGPTPFLVMKVGEKPKQFSAPALTLGILRANP